jgi:hypothetical protein
MREQEKYQMQWRLTRRVHGKIPLETTDSFHRASDFDKNDLHSANLEFENEIAHFKDWLLDKGKMFRAKAQEPGFDNDYEDEWEEISRWWNNPPPLNLAITEFFDNYVHDSRAWFKLIPGNPDNETAMVEKLKEWERVRVANDNYNAKRIKEISNEVTVLPPNARVMQQKAYVVRKDGLTDNQRNAAIAYAKTNKIPRMVTEGREPFESTRATLYLSTKAGYLRFRKIYSGWDSELISSNETVTPPEERVS